MDWIENQMDWNEYLSTWGVRLRSLAQGGLYYGEGGEADIPRYQRMQEIARELVEASEAVSDEQVAEMAQSLRRQAASLTEADADALARQLLGKKEGVAQEQVRVWGRELAEMADARLEEGLENLYDVGRFEAVRELGAQMRDLDL